MAGEIASELRGEFCADHNNRQDMMDYMYLRDGDWNRGYINERCYPPPLEMAYSSNKRSIDFVGKNSEC